jgi:septal ring factor EnvC (AmiA/AmiB activator)
VRNFLVKNSGDLLLLAFLLCCFFFAISLPAPDFAQECKAQPKQHQPAAQSFDKRIGLLEAKIVSQRTEIDQLTKRLEQNEKLVARIVTLIETMNSTKQIEKLGKQLEKVEENLRKLLPQQKPAPAQPKDKPLPKEAPKENPAVRLGPIA